MEWWGQSVELDERPPSEGGVEGGLFFRIEWENNDWEHKTDRELLTWLRRHDSCGVCGLGMHIGFDADDFLIECKECGLIVHASCYGSQPGDTVYSFTCALCRGTCANGWMNWKDSSLTTRDWMAAWQLTEAMLR